MADTIPTTIITRQQAKELGLKKYFTGKACKYGHIAERCTRTNMCRSCYLPCQERTAELVVLTAADKKRAYAKYWYAKNAKRLKKYNRKYYLVEIDGKYRRRARDKRKRLAHNFPYIRLIKGARTRAIARGVACDLSEAWAREKWTGKCEVTGVDFIVSKTGMNPFSPSIDRIRPEIGYIESNCRFVIFGYNALKGVGTDEDAITIACIIARNHTNPDIKQTHDLATTVPAPTGVLHSLPAAAESSELYDQQKGLRVL